MSDYQTPASATAESSLIGSILLDPSRYHKVKDVVLPWHFYYPAFRQMYLAIQWLHEHKQPIDSALLIGRLQDMRVLDEVGGPGAVTETVAAMPTAMYLEHYADTVITLAERRRLAEAAADIMKLAYSEDFDRNTARDEAISQVMSAVPHRVDSQWLTMKDAVKGALDQLDPLTRVPPIPTGIPSLDAHLGGGLFKGRCYCTAGRPGMGKTAFMVAKALSAAQSGAKVAFFSLEMTASEIAMRCIAMLTGINGLKLQSGRVDADGDEMERVLDAADVLAKLPIKFNPWYQAEGIIASSTALKAEDGLDVVFIDYLQLMETVRNSENRNLEIGTITRRLKNAAKELGIAIDMGSQLNRTNEGHKDKRPELASLRESGNIEQDMDVVFGMYREEYYTGEQKGMAECIILKHRQGPTGTVILGYDGATTRFYPRIRP